MLVLLQYAVTEDVRVQAGDRISLAVQEGALAVGCSGIEAVDYVMKYFKEDKFELKSQEFELCVSASYLADE